LRIILLSVSVARNEKPVLCDLPHLQLGFPDERYPVNIYSVPFFMESAFYCSMFLNALGNNLSPLSVAFYGGKQCEFTMQTVFRTTLQAETDCRRRENLGRDECGRLAGGARFKAHPG
jgi:hypothetical protein